MMPFMKTLACLSGSVLVTLIGQFIAIHDICQLINVTAALKFLSKAVAA